MWEMTLATLNPMWEMTLASLNPLTQTLNRLNPETPLLDSRLRRVAGRGSRSSAQRRPSPQHTGNSFFRVGHRKDTPCKKKPKWSYI